MDHATTGDIPLEPCNPAPINAYRVRRASWSLSDMRTSGVSFPAERVIPKRVYVVIRGRHLFIAEVPHMAGVRYIRGSSWVHGHCCFGGVNVITFLS